MIRYEDFERERLDPIYDIIEPYSEMSKTERYFLNGMIRYLKPKKILEVGVSSGGGSALILNAISDIDGAELYSVDYSEKAYRHPDKPSGFLVEEKFSGLMDKWHIYRGGDVSGFIENIGGDIDFLVLDTVHSHSWETLNFLCILPFMKKNFSWTVLHDISLFLYNRDNRDIHGFACRYLFGHVVSDEKVLPASDHELLPANIGAFKISNITINHVGNLFDSLLIPWECQVSSKDYDSMKRIVEKYYLSEQYKLFCDAFELQKYIEERRKKVKYSFVNSLKIFVRSWQPGLYNSLRKIKHFLKKN